MSTFLYRLGRACFRHKWRVIVIWLIAVLAIGAGSFAMKGKFDDSFSLPGAEAETALTQLKNTFPEISGTTAQIIVVMGENQRVESAQAPIDATVKKLGQLSFISSSLSPFDPIVNGQISPDHRAAMVTVKMPKQVAQVTQDERDAILALSDQLQRDIPGSTVKAGGEAFSVHMPHMSILDVAGVGVALIVLIFTLGSLIAASMPLITAILGALMSMAILLGATGLMQINSTSPILALMLALAVGIDYALFILSRHRDQLATGMDAEESAAEAVATAGSAVVFAGATVVIALLGLFIVNIPFLAIMGSFAAIAVAISVIIALTMLPAFMGLMGERMRPKKRAVAESDDAAGGHAHDLHMRAASWWVTVVTKAPIITIIVVILGLGALALPAKDMQLALPNSGRSVKEATDRQAFDLAAKYFGPGQGGPLLVTMPLVGSTDPLGVMKGLKEDIQIMPGVKQITLATPNRHADTGVVMVVPETGPDDKATETLVHDLRDKKQEWKDKYHVDTSVTGYTAAAIDVSERLANALLPFGLFVVGLSVILLTVVFRSIWVPIKAALGYLLSVGSAFGLTTLVFNKGWGMQLINLPETLPIIAFFPIMFMGILFGLAMDYEVFLVSRMREEHIHGLSARDSVTMGFIHSAKVVVAAALIMFSVFAFFIPFGDPQIIKPIAFGLAVGIAIDAFVVRMTLVPAIMWLLQERAWWLPRWLDRILPSLDIEGEALRHQVSLRDWPRPGATESIYAENLVLRQGNTTLVGGISLATEPGDVVVMVEPDPLRRAAVLAMLAGRIKPTAGEAKVAGLVLTTQGGEIRRHTTYLDQRSAAPSPKELQADLIFVNDADVLAESWSEELRSLVDNPGRRTVLLGVSDPSTLSRIVPVGGYTMYQPPAAGVAVGEGVAHARA